VISKALFSSSSAEWETPAEVFDPLNAEFGPFDLDAAATKTNTKAPYYYTKVGDGLRGDWTGRAVWLNPPYGTGIAQWISKAFNQTLDGGRGPASVVVVLVPARTDTEWWHTFVEPYRGTPRVEVRFLKGRVPFVRADGKRSRAPFPSVVLIFRRLPQ